MPTLGCRRRCGRSYAGPFRAVSPIHRELSTPIDERGARLHCLQMSTSFFSRRRRARPRARRLRRAEPHRALRAGDRLDRPLRSVVCRSQAMPGSPYRDRPRAFRMTATGLRFQLQPCLFSLSQKGFIRSIKAPPTARSLRTCSSARKAPPGRSTRNASATTRSTDGTLQRTSPNTTASKDRSSKARAIPSPAVARILPLDFSAFAAATPRKSSSGSIASSPVTAAGVSHDRRELATGGTDADTTWRSGGLVASRRAKRCVSEARGSDG